jgi:hypothetical protein
MGNTPSQTAENLTAAISRNIVTAISSSNLDSDFTQALIATCTQDKLKKQKICQNKCKESNCDYCNICQVYNVNMNQVVRVRESIADVQSVVSKVKTLIDTIISQKLEGAGAQDLSNVLYSRLVSGVLTTINSNIYKNASQIVSSKDNKDLRNISMNQAVDFAKDVLVNDTEYQDIVKKISIKIVQTNEETYKWVYYTCAIISALFFFLFFVEAVRKSKSAMDFLERATPYIAFVVLSAAVTLSLILSKPGFLTYTVAEDGTPVKKIQGGRMALALGICYAVLASGTYLTVYLKRTI